MRTYDAQKRTLVAVVFLLVGLTVGRIGPAAAGAAPFEVRPLAAPLVGAAITPGAGGYWLVAADGGVFSYGDARFFGSTGALVLDQPIVAAAATPSGDGYWLIARDGGVFAFGDAAFLGSTGALALAAPIVAAHRAGDGYRFVAVDGGVFSFGAPFLGSTGGQRVPMVVGAAGDASGYVLVTAAGTVATFGAVADHGGPGPTYASSIEPVDRAQRVRMTPSAWRPGCPVGLDDLRLVRVVHWDFEGVARGGELVVHASVAPTVARAFGDLFANGFPIERVEPIEHYGGSDDASTAANNTSAFNCRAVGGTGRWSMHSYGEAIDVNPVQNPYVYPDGSVLDPAARPYLDRGDVRPGMAVEGGVLVAAFDRVGWGWGGRPPIGVDHQHFSPTGR